MHPEFGDWYRLVQIEPKSDVLSARWSGVEKVAKSTTPQSLLELIRMALGRAPRGPDYRNSFVEFFRQADSAFPASDNDAELAVLAGSAWLHLLGDQSLSANAALVMAAASATSTDYTKLVAQYRLIATQFLLDTSVTIRTNAEWPAVKIGEPKVEQAAQAFAQALQQNQWPTAASSFQPVVEKIADWIKKVSAAQKALSDHAERAFLIQKEQGDIAWWVLGGYSQELKDSLANVTVAKSCLALGKELADLITMLPGPLAARAVLDRMLRLGGDGKNSAISLREVVNGVAREKREEWIRDAQSGAMEDLVPIHLALFKSLETTGSNDWVPAARKSTGLNLKDDRHPLDLAEQFYTERLSVKAVAETTG